MTIILLYHQFLQLVKNNFRRKSLRHGGSQGGAARSAPPSFRASAPPSAGYKPGVILAVLSENYGLFHHPPPSA